ncbi:MAG: hypothetical protein KIT62_06055 [Cyclobacteriaceae bacterium]|nr:hypothetical protein [Cyclobacteriaceae bacterium]
MAVFGLSALSLLTACEDPDTITLEISEPVVFSVNETAVNSSGKDYDVSAWLDISQNPDVISYINKIEEVKVIHIEYAVSNADPQDISLNEGTIATSAGFDIIKSLPLPLSNTSSGQLTFHPPGVNDLATRLKGSGKDHLHLSGYLTRTPLICTVTVTFHLSIKARAT